MNKKEPLGKDVLELARVKDVSMMLGITQKRVRDLVKEGKIQAHRLPKAPGENVSRSGSTLYFTRHDVMEYIQWKYGEDDND